MAVGRRHPVPLLLLLLLAAWVTGATSATWATRATRATFGGHHGSQRHADFYRTRYRAQPSAPRLHIPHHMVASSYHNTVRAANRKRDKTTISAHDEIHHRRQEGGDVVQWEQRPDRRDQRRYAARDAVYHRRHAAAASIRRSDTLPTWPDDVFSSSGGQPGRQPGQGPGQGPGQKPAEAAAATRDLGRRPAVDQISVQIGQSRPALDQISVQIGQSRQNRPAVDQISVQIGQSRQNFSVRDGVVIGAERVKLWRRDRPQSGGDLRELNEMGGEVWWNNGTALYRSTDVSEYQVLTNEISDIRTTQQLDRDKQAKFFFPLFTLIRFPNDPCQGSQQDGFSASGTCYLPQECSDRGGLARGSCALGFGVCCVFTLSCGGTTDKNGTFFVNPEYPDSSSTARTCSFSVQKVSTDVTQIRLDFQEFTMAGPTDGSCNTDTFSVSGQNTNAPVPTLCGQNSGQHVYVEVGERTGPIQLRTVTGPGTSQRRWRVQVTQYTRRADGAAPSNCLQYHTGQLGSIESFNYPATGDEAGYLNQLNYMICIRKESGFCSITYGVDRFDRFSTPEQFEIFNVKVTIVNGVMVVRATVPAGQAGVGPIQCPDDYILLSADRLCGDRLNDGSVNSQLTQNADVTDATGGQFTVKFVTNESTVGRGFRLYFRQNPCRSRRSYFT